MMLHPYSRNRFIYHAHSNYAFRCEHMTQCQHNLGTTGLRRHIGSRTIMHDAMTSIRFTCCVAKYKEKHIQHNGIIGFLIKLGHTWPILSLAHKTVKWNKPHGFQT